MTEGSGIDGLAVLNVVPEPGSITLLGLGLAGALGWTRFRRQRAV